MLLMSVCPTVAMRLHGYLRLSAYLSSSFSAEVWRPWTEALCISGAGALRKEGLLAQSAKTSPRRRYGQRSPRKKNRTTDLVPIDHLPLALWYRRFVFKQSAMKECCMWNILSDSKIPLAKLARFTSRPAKSKAHWEHFHAVLRVVPGSTST